MPTEQEITTYLATLSQTRAALVGEVITFEQLRYNSMGSPWQEYGATLERYAQRLWESSVNLVHWAEEFIRQNHRQPFMLDVMGDGTGLEDERIGGGAYICLQQFNDRGEEENRRQRVGDKPIIGCFGDVLSAEVYQQMVDLKKKLGIPGFDIVVFSPVGGYGSIEKDVNQHLLLLSLCLEWLAPGGVLIFTVSNDVEITLNKGRCGYLEKLCRSGDFKINNYWTSPVTVFRLNQSSAHFDSLPPLK